jgi:plasmid stabilization system protein ParE
MQRFVLTAAARVDLSEIADYIREDNPAAARRVVSSLLEAMRELARSPGMGHFREDLTRRPFRFWSVYSYLIVYNTETQPLQILRILHSARDVKSILAED